MVDLFSVSYASALSARLGRHSAYLVRWDNSLSFNGFY